MRTRPWAPPSAAAVAIAATSETLGLSFASTGASVSARQRSRSARVSPASVPIEMQPDSTLGQETFSSIAATAGWAPTRATAVAYSDGDQPPTLTMTGTPSSPSRGRCPAQKASRPGFASPIEFTIPAGVSAMRTGGLPSRGCSVTVFVTKAPSPSVPAASASSVPDPFTSGLRSAMPQNSARRSGEDTRRLHDGPLDAEPLPRAVDADGAPVAGAEAARHGGLHRELTGDVVLGAQGRNRLEHPVGPAGVHRRLRREQPRQRLRHEHRIEDDGRLRVDERGADRVLRGPEPEHGPHVAVRHEPTPQPREDGGAD